MRENSREWRKKEKERNVHLLAYRCWRCPKNYQRQTPKYRRLPLCASSWERLELTSRKLHPSKFAFDHLAWFHFESSVTCGCDISAAFSFSLSAFVSRSWTQFLSRARDPSFFLFLAHASDFSFVWSTRCNVKVSLTLLIIPRRSSDSCLGR